MALQSGVTILNKYRIVKLLGEGGMARVWLAEELTFGKRLVALKEPRPNPLSDDAAEIALRYQREVQVCAALEQAGVPQIVRAITAEPYEDGLLLVMAYMPGGDLASLIRQHPNGLPPERAVAIALDVLAALAGAHSHPLEIIHRDVKPSNILFDGEGRAHLADFGLAQLAGVSGRSQLSGGHHPGTPAYMAPEQETSMGYLSPAADLFALGCVLWEMLTGKRYKRFKPGTPPSLERAGSPSWLDDVALKALAESPWNRWQSAREMAEALRSGQVAEQRMQQEAEARRRAEEQARQAREERSRQETERARMEAEIRQRQEAETAARQRREAEDQAQHHAQSAETLGDHGVAQRLPPSQSRRQDIVGHGDEAVSAMVVPQVQDSYNRTKYPSRTRRVWPRVLVAMVVMLATLLMVVIVRGSRITELLRGAISPDPVGILTPGPSQQSGTKTPDAVVTTDSADLRQGPGQEYPAVGRYPRGITMTVTGKDPSGAWLKVQMPANKDGWVLASDLRVYVDPHTVPTVEAPPTPTPQGKYGMVFVPGGQFLFGSQNDDSRAESDEKPQRSVYLDDYWIDQTEITNKQYLQCIQAENCVPSDTDSVCALADSIEPDHPVVCIGWQEAADYCAWAGKRLPTEAEWEKAARGAHGQTYPWGNSEPSCSKAQHAGCELGTLAVGSRPEGSSPFRALDMAGNAGEWVADWYAADYYATSPDKNPTGPANGEYRVVRGGSWITSSEDLRSANRDKSDSGNLGDQYIGFRCARFP